jgi:hypothetical protein
MSLATRTLPVSRLERLPTATAARRPAPMVQMGLSKLILRHICKAREVFQSLKSMDIKDASYR